MQPALLDDVRAHDQVRVPVPAGIRAVRADAADLGREVEDERRLRFLEQPVRVDCGRQIEGAAARDKRFDPFRVEPLDEMRPEKPAAAGDEDVHVAERSCASQSTRPSQRSRFAAYHAIVREMPSSQDIVGAHPVSAWSFS